MHRKKLVKLLVITLLAVAACSDNTTGVYELPQSSPSLNVIQNPGFEDDNQETQTPAGWTITGDTYAAKVTANGCEGKYALTYESESFHSVTTTQTIEVEDGTYDLEFYYKNSGGQEACFLAIGTNESDLRMTSLHVSPHVWTRSIIKGFKIEGGTTTIRITTHSEGGTWTYIDALKLKKAEEEYTFLKGGDLSQLTYIERMGGKFFDQNGQERDCIELLAENGFNIARLRLYNDPGNPDHDPSNQLPAGIQNPADILNLAKRAKQAGMQIQLTFHYSDYWSNAEVQYKPHKWENLGYEDLKQALYDFTHNFMTQMKNQGTTPEYVALGNETGTGILHPDGDHLHFNQMAELFNQGYDAVKAVSPETNVIIHLADAGNTATYDWFFGELNTHGGKYDMIGTSYYPFWTKESGINKKANQIAEWADQISQKYNKNIIIIETGYKWHPTLPNSNSGGQLWHNGPYEDIYPSSPEGQRDYLLELFTGIKNAPGSSIKGCLYWDPIFIDVPGVGWILGKENFVSNTTLFDFNGKRLPALNAYKFNN